MSKLITPSLFSSVSWYMNAPVNYRQEAYASLHGMLARKYGPPTFILKRGLDFEDKIYNLCTRKVPIEKINSSDYFKTFLENCYEGQFQVKTKSFLVVDGIEYCLYGKIDVLFPDCIIDIKTTSKWNSYSPAKYLDSMQHIIYLYNENMDHFKYLIAVFEGTNSNKIKETHILEVYEPLKEKLKEQIIKAIQKLNRFFVAHPILLELYNTTYSKY